MLKTKVSRGAGISQFEVHYYVIFVYSINLCRVFFTAPKVAKRMFWLYSGVLVYIYNYI